MADTEEIVINREAILKITKLWQEKNKKGIGKNFRLALLAKMADLLLENSAPEEKEWHLRSYMFFSMLQVIVSGGIKTSSLTLRIFLIKK